MDKNLPIGVFDSGVGGLTVVDAIRKKLPNEHIIYLGDTARVPYGNRGAETIRRYAINAAQLLMSRGIKALVIACNTASAHGLAAIRDRVTLPVLGVIDPVAEHAIEVLSCTENPYNDNFTNTQDNGVTHRGPAPPHTIAILATRATIASNVYPRSLKQYESRVNVVQRACPLLVPFAEEGLHHDPLAYALVERYLKELRHDLSEPILDAIILGCTHYPLFQDTIEEIASRLFTSRDHQKPHIFNSAESTADKLQFILESNNLANTVSAPPTLELLATDSPESFAELAARIFGDSLSNLAPELSSTSANDAATLLPYVHHVDISEHAE